MSSPEPEFGSVGEADAAYYGSSNDGGGNNQNNQNGDQNSNQNGNGTSYGELQRIEFLAGEWALVYQDARASDRQRFFVLKSDGETIQAIEADGVVVEETAEQGALDRLPSYESEPAAREAHQAWVDSQENGGENGPGAGGGQGGQQYGEWTRIEQVGPWVVWGREAKDADARQFVAASTNTSGTAIYLQPEGEVAETAHVFEDTAALQDALEAFAERERRGDVPTDESPTGASPDKSTIAAAADEAGANEGGGGGGGPLSGVVRAVGGPRNAVILAAGGGMGLYYANERGIIDVPGLDGPAPGGANV